MGLVCVVHMHIPFSPAVPIPPWWLLECLHLLWVYYVLLWCGKWTSSWSVGQVQVYSIRSIRAWAIEGESNTLCRTSIDKFQSRAVLPNMKWHTYEKLRMCIYIYVHTWIYRTCWYKYGYSKSIIGLHVFLPSLQQLMGSWWHWHSMRQSTLNELVGACFSGYSATSCVRCLCRIVYIKLL